MTETLWLLVARGGSKGVPGKNMRRVGGITLVEWKVRAARDAGATAIVCSSDSQEILAEAQRLGCSVIERPAELATDDATTADVVRHALDVLTEAVCVGDEGWDRVVLLEPSAPFTTGTHYRRALAMMDENDADLVVGMKEIIPHPLFMGDVRDDKSITPIIIRFQRHRRRRQDHPRTWTMAGNLYVFKTDMFLRTGDIYGGDRNYGLMTDRWHGIDIDTMDDLELAEHAVERGHVAAP